MSIFRTILVSFVALAVAMLPLAGGFASASAAHGFMVRTVSADCCEKGGPCEKPMPDCGSLVGCMAKCASVSVSGTETFELALTVFASERAPLTAQQPLAPAESPPPPPPRL